MLIILVIKMLIKENKKIDKVKLISCTEKRY